METLVFSNRTSAGNFVIATPGPPASGTWAKGDLVVDSVGRAWVCTVAGTPGTWADVSSGRELGYAEVTSSFAPGNGTLQDVPGLSVTFTPGVRPVRMIFFAQSVFNSIANGGITLQIAKSDNTVLMQQVQGDATASQAQDATVISRKTFTPNVPVTAKVRIGGTFGGNLTMTASVTAPASLQVVEC